MMLAYFIKANIILALFYVLYRLLCNRDTFFTWRRAALLGMFPLAAIIPLAQVPEWLGNWEALHPLQIDVLLPDLIVTPQGEVHTATGWPLPLLGIAYWVVAGLFGLRFMFRLLSIIYMVRRCPAAVVNGVKVRLLPEGSSPFSFFGWIFVRPDAYPAGELDEILAHEQAHAKQWHSVDVLAGEAMRVVCWCNPFVWLICREMHSNLEYLADRQVLRAGYDPKTYQLHLLELAYQPKAIAPLSNNFNVLPLKKRITMMNKKQSNKAGKAKYLLFLPAAALLAVACNNAGNTQEASNDEAADAQITEVVTATQGNDESTTVAPIPEAGSEEQVYDVVEQMPEFPGGIPKLMEYLKESLKYPAEAKEAGTQGRVVCQFVVTKEGDVTDVKVIREVDPLLDAEAVRVLKAMPKWKPGMVKGEAVNVRYTVPVMFKLS